MKYLNLSEGFNPFQADPEDIIAFESFTFPGGEPHIKIGFTDFDDIMISIRIQSFNDMGLLAMTNEALEQSGYVEKKHLFIPYFPGARQDVRNNTEDRVEPLSVKVYAGIINEMDFDSVYVFDAHSAVTLALIDNCEVITNHGFVKEVIEEELDKGEDDCNLVLIAPDAGAGKKIHKLVKYMSEEDSSGFVYPVIECGKRRDPATGALSGFDVYTDDLKGKDCVIIDDICDGGGTFLGIAEELRRKNAGDLYLVVSHGIFSKGFDELKKVYKRIYTTDSFESVDKMTPLYQLFGLLRTRKITVNLL